MSKFGPENTGKEEVPENAAQYTPLKKIYSRADMLKLQPKGVPDNNILQKIANAGVLKLRSKL
ncbi:MAG: hypothetical protein HYX61_10500 [Gammaproteobacteria bacterium]|jgi:hypothetical protein|nr:hypothetical protein [Gammaproteobacteria bacterium]